MDPIFWLLFLFVTKHLICDYFLQFPYQYKNKGVYGHAGGILHAAIHFWGTFVVLNLFALPWYKVLVLSMLDGVVHYNIDWLKIYVNSKFKWGPTTTDAFWHVLGIDQYLHYATYFLIVYLAITF